MVFSESARLPFRGPVIQTHVTEPEDYRTAGTRYVLKFFCLLFFQEK